jgi:creatinine amidohydrolase
VLAGVWTFSIGEAGVQWELLTRPELDRLDRERTVVILPLGAVEQHGEHLGLGTDSLLSAAVARRAAEIAGAQLPIVLLPPPWYGYSPHHMSFAGTITLRAETFLKLVEDIVDSVLRHGFRRVFLLNGHGGNVSIMDVMLSELGRRWHGCARIGGATYFSLARARQGEFRDSQAGGMGHACEFETSLMQYLYPEAARAEGGVTCYPETGSAYRSTDLFGASQARTYTDFHDLSPSGTFGDPRLASAEKGQRIFDICVQELLNLLRDFASWPISGRI